MTGCAFFIQTTKSEKLNKQRSYSNFNIGRLKIENVLILTLSCFGEDLIGKVVSVYDGDTITVLSGNTQHMIRLEGIDTPESKQPFGSKAKQAISRMVFGKQVKVVWKKKDRYGRTLGHVYVNGKWTNLQMIK